MGQGHPSTDDLLAQTAWLRRLARSLLDEAAAEDVLQETYAAALTSPPGPHQPLRPWLATVLRNFARMAFRGDKRRQGREQAMAEAPAPNLPTPEELLAQHQARRLVADAVEALEEPFRSTILLCYGEGLAPTEIARRLGILPGTVRWRLKRALELLRERLDRRTSDHRSWALLLGPLVRPRRPAVLMTTGVMLMKTKILAAVAVLILLLVWLGLRARTSPTAEFARTHSPTIERHAIRSRVPGPRFALAEAARAGVTDDAGEIEGTVRDDRGRPIAGASVAAVPLISLSELGAGRRPVGPAALGVSDASGHFRLGRLARSSFGVTATARGFTPAHHSAIEVGPRGHQRVDLVLAAGGVTMEGRVLDAEGGPVIGARVMALALDGPAPDTTRIFAARSGESGGYELHLARATRYGFAADADGYAQTRLPVESLDGDRSRDIVLRPASQVSGRVIDRQSGAPIPQALVRLARADGGDIPFMVTTSSDERGEFVLGGVIPASYRLWARQGARAGRHETPLMVGEAEMVSGVVIALEPRPAVRGRVSSTDGQPLPGAQLWLVREEGIAAQEPRASADARGGYEVDGILTGNYVVRASVPGFSAQSHRVGVQSADIDGLDFVLAPEARVRGRVSTVQGEPAAMVRVLAMMDGGPGRGDGAFQSTRTRADGTFVLEGIAPGQLRIGAEDARLGLARAVLVTVRSGDGNEVNLRLEPGARLSGRVRLPGGGPASGIFVSVFQGPTGWPTITRSGRTRPDGSFTVQALGGGPTRVLASRSEVASEPRELPPGAAAATVPATNGNEVPDVVLVLP